MRARRKRLDETAETGPRRQARRQGDRVLNRAWRSAPTPNPVRSRRLRILVIEDNADGRETLKAILTLQGHEVHEAADGLSGADLALAVRPDVALIDIGLPGIDGYEVARRVRAGVGGGLIKLIAFTGYGQEEDVRRAKVAGFDACLVKPVEFDALEEILAGT